VQQTPPGDALLEWKRTPKKITGQIVIIVKSADIEAGGGSGQGKAKAPAMQAILKPAFNQHAVRDPGTSRTNLYLCIDFGYDSRRR